MVDEYKKIRNMCNNINISEGQSTDEYLFTLHAVDLFYYKRNIGEIDIKNGFTDGPKDGGIDFIYSDDETMYLIQGKSSQNLSTDEIFNVFNKIVRTVKDFERENYNEYSKQLQSIYLNTYDNLNSDKNISFVLFTNTKIDDDTKNSIINKCDESNDIGPYKIYIYDRDDIENIKIEENSLITEDSIDIDLGEKNNNILQYGENGIIVNAKASSIKKLYDKYGKNGLFSYNIREYISQNISQKNVDNAINNTISKEPENFWFFNNGVTIGCENFRKDGNKIRLYNFSIINGAQTTTILGKSNLIKKANDFDIVCKIITTDDQDFINRISEASNSQKPIKPRDLKANSFEQRRLQQKCEKNGDHSLAIEVKRGVKPKNNKKVNPEYRVTNEYVGQLVLACLLQKPGPARSDKNSLFSSSTVYNDVFKHEYDCDTLYDLVKLAHIYDEYNKKYLSGEGKDDSEDALNKLSVIRNGKLFILAVVIFLYKKKIGVIEKSDDKNLHGDNIDGLLISEYKGDDLEERLSELFDFIIGNIILPTYEYERVSKKITSFSNFFKTESYYKAILKKLDSLGKYDVNKVNYCLEVFAGDGNI